jgi:hypothetical protein
VEPACPERTENLQIEALIEQISTAICRRGMALPAVFLLEAHKPLSRLVHSAAQVSQPLLGALCGGFFTSRLVELLESPRNIELLIQSIELRSRGGAS